MIFQEGSGPPVPPLDPPMLACWAILLSSAVFFSKLTSSKNSSRNTIRVSNSLDPDQGRQNVLTDLGPNCSVDYKSVKVEEGLEQNRCTFQLHG